MGYIVRSRPVFPSPEKKQNKLKQNKTNKILSNSECSDDSDDFISLVRSSKCPPWQKGKAGPAVSSLMILTLFIKVGFNILLSSPTYHIFHIVKVKF